MRKNTQILNGLHNYNPGFLGMTNFNNIKPHFGENVFEKKQNMSNYRSLK